MRRTANVLVACVLGAAGLAPLAPASAAAPAGYPSTAAGARASEWWLDAMGIRKAWSITKGAGVTIADIDTGIDPSVAELHGAVVPGTDLSHSGRSDGEQPVPTIPTFPGGPPDDGSHGTLTSALAVGRGNGAGGTLGSAPEAKVLPISVLFDGRYGKRPAFEAVQCDNAMHYAVDHGARVINVSAGLDCSGDGVKYAQQHNAVIVASAGNDGILEQLDTRGKASRGHLLAEPARLAGVVAVSGINRDLSFAKNSSWGSKYYILGNDFQSGGVALAAPYEVSETITIAVTTIHGRYKQVTGTSIAAPIVSGMAALIISKYPKMSAADVISRLLHSAKVPGGGTIPDAHYGFGVPDAYRALTTDTPHLSANPLGQHLNATVTSGQEVPGVWGPQGLTVFQVPKGTPGSAEFAQGTRRAKSSAPPKRAAPVISSGDGSRKKLAALLMIVAAIAAAGAAYVFWTRGRTRPAR